MPIVALLAALAAASSPPEGDRPTILVLDLAASDVRESEAQLISGDVARTIDRHPELRVLTQSDLQRMIDVEADKQAFGCDTSSCLAELGGAMGAAYVVHGTVGRLGSLYVVQLNLFDSSRAVAVGREEARAQRLEDLAEALVATGDRLLAPLGVEPLVRPVASEEEPAAPSRALLWTGAAIAGTGSIVAIGAGAGAAFAEARLGQTGAAIKAGDKDLARTLGVAALVGLGLGAAATAVGGGLVTVSVLQGEP